MATLFDTLKATMATPAPAAAPQQAQVQKVLRAKSGKATNAAGPGASSLAESQTIAAGQTQGATLATQGNIAATELRTKADDLTANTRVANAGLDTAGRQAADSLATQNTATRDTLQSREQLAGEQRQSGEELKVKQINNAAEQKMKELASDRKVTTSDLFASFKQSKDELRMRKDAAELEQIGFLMAMQDKSYVDELNRIGQERNLMDEIAFRDEMQRVTLGNNTTDLLSELGFKSTYNMQEREYEKQLAKIDVGAALKLAEASIRDSNNQAMVQGGIDTAKAGADAWAGSNKTSTAPEYKPGYDAGGNTNKPDVQYNGQN